MAYFHQYQHKMLHFHVGEIKTGGSCKEVTVCGVDT